MVASSENYDWSDFCHAMASVYSGNILLECINVAICGVLFIDFQAKIIIIGNYVRLYTRVASDSGYKTWTIYR